MQIADRPYLTSNLQRATVLTLAAALAFGIFFQLSKTPALSAVNPFADDPVDAIGSFAVQVALAVSILTLARAAQFKLNAPDSYRRSRLILRGNFVALSAIAITLIADTYMEVQQPSWDVSIWGQLLVIGLSIVAVLTLAAGLATLNVTSQMRSVCVSKSSSLDNAGALAEALGDLWSLARAVLVWLGRKLVILRQPVHWAEKIGDAVLDKITNMPRIGARVHPWRFCALVALLIGFGVSLAHGLGEGLPANLATAAFVALFFIVVEFVAVLLGFLLLGGFLGIRPPLGLHRQ